MSSPKSCFVRIHHPNQYKNLNDEMRLCTSTLEEFQFCELLLPVRKGDVSDIDLWRFRVGGEWIRRQAIRDPTTLIGCQRIEVYTYNLTSMLL